ncbi:TPA: hypothetical protein ACPVZG_000542 [Vibrio parahaemolyticus]
MRLGRLQKEVVEHLRENGGQAAILFGQKICSRFRFSDESDFMPSIERLIERGIITRLTPHYMYKLNED